MEQSAPSPAGGTSKAGKAQKPQSEAKEPKSRRSSYAALYPENAKIKLLVAENPKKAGSASRARFEHYFKSETVGDYLHAGGTYADILYDVGHKFIEVEPV